MKGDFSLEAMDANVFGDHFESWRLVEEQLKFGDMPPENKKQPSKDERQGPGLLRSELLKAHNLRINSRKTDAARVWQLRSPRRAVWKVARSRLSCSLRSVAGGLKSTMPPCLGSATD